MGPAAGLTQVSRRPVGHRGIAPRWQNESVSIKTRERHRPM
jgi:hypothetical protein